MAEPLSLLPPHAPPAPAAAPVPPALRRAAEEFEALALAQMLQPMFAELDTEGMGGGGFGEQIFRPMLVEEYAKSIAQTGGVGLAQSLIAEFQRLQSAVAPEAVDGADR